MSAASPTAAPSGITDFHVHINPWNLLKPGVAKAIRKHQPDFAKIRRYYEDARVFLALMDEESVRRACLINYVAPDVMGYPPSINDWVAAYASADRTRLIPFGGIHPAHVKDAKKEVERLVYTLELGGMKIQGPHMNVAPNAYLDGTKALRVLYETCEREGVPIMFHTGTTIFPGARIKYGDPLLLDDVAIDFPKLKIVMAHGGRPLWTEAAWFLLRRHPNIALDLSGIPPAKIPQYFPRLDEIQDRVVYGSDWPGPNVPGMRANAEAVATALGPHAWAGSLFSKNAARLLRRA